MEYFAKKIDEHRNVSCQEHDEYCPSLILDKKVTCDARNSIFHPVSRQVKEYCLTEQYTRCPLFDSLLAQG